MEKGHGMSNGSLVGGCIEEEPQPTLLGMGMGMRHGMNTGFYTEWTALQKRVALNHTG